MIKAILFDCYGVVLGKGMWTLFTEAGGTDMDFLNWILVELNSGRMPSDEYHQKLADHLGMSLKDWREFHDSSEVPNTDLLNYIRSQLKPAYKVSILSNANSGSVEKRLGSHLDLFDDKVISADVGAQKPDPEIFRLAAQRIDVLPEQCVFVDDHAPYFVGAKSVGMQTILFKDFEQLKVELENALG